MSRLPLRLNKHSAVRTIVQAAVFIGAVFLPVGIFHMICPMGGIAALTRVVQQGLFVQKTGVTNLILLAAVLIAGILAGPVFCGWLCPLGSVQDWIQRLAMRLKVKQFSIPRKADVVLSFARYIVLALVIFATARTFNLMFINIDPYYALMHFWTGEAAPAALIILAAVILLSLFVKRPWCRWFCPLGAVLGPLGKISIFKIRKPSSSCVSCGACSRSCPAGLDPSLQETVNNSHCIRCGLCGPACPPKLRTDKNNFRIPFITAIILAVFFFTAPFIAQKTGFSPSAHKNTFTLEPQRTIAEFAAGYSMSEQEALSFLELPSEYSVSTRLIDIEDDYEHVTWKLIQGKAAERTALQSGAAPLNK